MTKRASIAVVPLCIVLAQSARDDFAAGTRACDKGDYATELREFRPLADQGHAAAHSANSASCTSKAQGVARDYDETARWYRKAARWSRKAADQGDANAQLLLGCACIASVKECRRTAWRRIDG